jgi:phospholipid/cholesterol/gamma-HCH transport system substrate-binding protein
MEKSKGLEIKVGLFVAVGLILLATLLLQFSKSSSLFRGSYQLRLHAENVGGIKPRAQVLLAGVQVGTVTDIKLSPDGKSVTILLSIYNEYPIYHDANFVIQQAGFLGDQYVSINPTANTLPMLTNGVTVDCESPFDLQEVARTAAGFITRLDGTAKKLDASVTDFRREVLNERTLTNFDIAINNVRAVSEQAMATVSNLNNLVVTNRDQVDRAISNIVFFSHQLNGLADSADEMLASNGAQISVATRNIADSTATLKSVVSDVQAGKGLAGTILQNEELSSNVQAIASNLAETTSNLNQVGLWGILWAPKHHKEENSSEPVTPNHPIK